MMLGDFGHGTGGLAGGQDQQPSGGRRRQMRPQAALGVRRSHRGAEQALEERARRFGQGSGLTRGGKLERHLARSAAQLVRLHGGK